MARLLSTFMESKTPDKNVLWVDLEICSM